MATGGTASNVDFRAAEISLCRIVVEPGDGVARVRDDFAHRCFRRQAVIDVGQRATAGDDGCRDEATIGFLVGTPIAVMDEN